MKLTNLKVIKKATINAKAEGKKKNTTTRKSSATKEQVGYKDIVDEKVIDITDTASIVVKASQTDNTEDTFIDIRTFLNFDGEVKPTKKGVHFHVEHLEGLIDALTKLNEELEAKGI